MAPKAGWLTRGKALDNVEPMKGCSPVAPNRRPENSHIVQNLLIFICFQILDIISVLISIFLQSFYFSFACDISQDFTKNILNKWYLFFKKNCLKQL